MSSSDRVLAGVVLVCLLGAGCLPADSGSAPRPRQLVPGWGLTTEAVAGIIEGDNFLELATQHVGGPEPVTLDARFEAFLGGVALEDVRRESEHRLRVRIPEGLSPGWHPLTVVGPGGQRVELPQAFYASAWPLASLEARSAWSRPRLWVGEQARLALEVSNPGATVALAVTAVLRPERAGSTEVLSAPGPLDIAPGASASFVWELRTASAGEPRFAVDLEGREERVGLALAVVGVDVAPLQVRDRPGAPLALALEAAPQTLNVGQQVRLTLRVTNTGAQPVLDVAPGTPALDVELTRRLSGPVPARADLAPGAHQDFEWTYLATASGPLSFRVGAGGRDDFVGEAVVASEVRSSELTVRRPAALEARFVEVPASARVHEDFPVVLRVRNLGDSAVRGVRLDDTGITGSCRVSVVHWPVPASLDLDGQEEGRFEATLRGTTPGACVLRAGVRGRDATDGRDVTAPTDDSSPILIR